jgi:ABC-type Fe3+ transport system permease subunit
MTHYQKIATLLFRVVAIIIALSGLIFSIVTFLGNSTLMHPLGILVLALPPMVVGAGIFAFSRYLSGLVCFDFDKWND